MLKFLVQWCLYMLYRLLNWSLFKLLYPDILSSYQNKKGKLQIWSLTDDALIVSRMKSSRMKSSSLILILETIKEELSYTGVVPATESPMPKSEGVNQKKLC